MYTSVDKTNIYATSMLSKILTLDAFLIKKRNTVRRSRS